MPSARSTLLLTLALGVPLAHGGPPSASMPPPGQYRIDGEASVRSGGGPTTAERIERWDGASGNRTVILHAGPGNPSHQQTYAGTGPVTWCVHPPAAPPSGLPDRCKTRWQSGDGAATLQAECQAGRLQESWNQLDARTWERRMRVNSSGAALGGDPSAALAFVQRGLSPAEAARARAEIAALPGLQATADAMAPVYAQIEETIRKGSPQEAAAARQQLAALQAAQGGGGAASTTTQLTERWTRIADACAAGS